MVKNVLVIEQQIMEKGNKYDLVKGHAKIQQCYEMKIKCKSDFEGKNYQSSEIIIVLYVNSVDKVIEAGRYQFNPLKDQAIFCFPLKKCSDKNASIKFRSTFQTIDASYSTPISSMKIKKLNSNSSIYLESENGEELNISPQLVQCKSMRELQKSKKHLFYSSKLFASNISEASMSSKNKIDQFLRTQNSKLMENSREISLKCDDLEKNNKHLNKKIKELTLQGERLKAKQRETELILNEKNGELVEKENLALKARQKFNQLHENLSEQQIKRKLLQKKYQIVEQNYQKQIKLLHEKLLVAQQENQQSIFKFSNLLDEHKQKQKQFVVTLKEQQYKMNDERSSLNSQLRILNSKISELHEQLKKKQTFDYVEAEEKSKVDFLKKQIENLQCQINQQSVIMMKLSENNQGLIRSIEQKDQEIEKNKLELKNKNSILLQQTNRFQENAKLMQKQISLLQLKIIGLESNSKKILLENKSLILKNDQLMNSLSEKQQQLIMIESKIVMLNKIYKEKQEKSKEDREIQFNNEIALKNLNNNLIIKQSKLEAQIERLNQIIEELNNEANELKYIQQLLKKQSEHYKQQIVNHSQTSRENNRRFSEYEEQLHLKSQEANNLQEKLDQLQAILKNKSHQTFELQKQLTSNQLLLSKTRQNLMSIQSLKDIEISQLKLQFQNLMEEFIELEVENKNLKQGVVENQKQKVSYLNQIRINLEEKVDERNRQMKTMNEQKQILISNFEEEFQKIASEMVKMHVENEEMVQSFDFTKNNLIKQIGQHVEENVQLNEILRNKDILIQSLKKTIKKMEQICKSESEHQ